MFIRFLVADGAVGIDMDDRRSAGALEFVAARALSHTYDEFLIRSAMWATPGLGILLKLYARVRRTNVYLYTNLVWRFVSATIAVLIVLRLLTPRT
jgi:hypothetical protein